MFYIVDMCSKLKFAVRKMNVIVIRFLYNTNSNRLLQDLAVILIKRFRRYRYHNRNRLHSPSYHRMSDISWSVGFAVISKISLSTSSHLRIDGRIHYAAVAFLFFGTHGVSTSMVKDNDLIN